MKYTTQEGAMRYAGGLVLGLLVWMTLVATPAHGGAIIPPRHLGELARISDAVVLAQAGAAFTLARGGMIYTQTTFDVIDVVSGSVSRNASMVVETMGGVLNGEGWVFGGSPTFDEDTVYLLFLNREGDVWQPRMLAYGMLERVEAADGTLMLNHIEEHHDLELLPRPDGIIPEPLGAYYEAPLLNHLREVTTLQQTWDGTRVTVPATLRPAGHYHAAKTQTIPEPCAYLTYEGHPIRWDAFDE